jgi:hypothetical protein
MSLVQIRAFCTEQSDKGEVIKTAPVKQFVSSVGHKVRTVQHPVDQMLGIGPDAQGLSPVVRNSNAEEE